MDLFQIIFLLLVKNVYNFLHSKKFGYLPRHLENREKKSLIIYYFNNQSSRFGEFPAFLSFCATAFPKYLGTYI